ncbi:hypothetical protein POJ06DRAFT_202705 [Lipomyces tetrasporus]|uniref:F-box domain-containing protein n=1 Tax=Lipomyces tetrasporus TaxID=54092 RepID=A0AAD7QL23_9ASCO|nr:uncharacterized protein POJ06DRAFT_202705 [Lipomyces tetrasporus]KAJ8097064.1 hypothetical protein POJ06DRAFT_202705 [Lipomyces tetrasporus]
MPMLLSLPNEVLLQIYSGFRGSDFYGSVLVNKHLNGLLTVEMYRHLKLFLPKCDSISTGERDPCGTTSDDDADFWDNDDGLVDLFGSFSVDNDMSAAALADPATSESSPNEKHTGSLPAKCYRKGSGALLKRTFKENPELASLVKVLTVVGHDLQPEDITTTEDGMAEFPMPPDTAFRGVRNLLRHLTSLEHLAFQGDSAQLSAFIYSVPQNITSLSLERLSRLQFGDIYMFRKLRRLTIRAPPSNDKTVNGSGDIVLSKSVVWETLYAIRMLLEQNSQTLEELILGNWNFDMLFQAYVPMLPRLKCLAIELAPPMTTTKNGNDASVQTTTISTSPLLHQHYPQQSLQAAQWPWLAEFISSVRTSLKVYISCTQPHTADEAILQQMAKFIDWKSLHKLEGGRRVKRKSKFRGHRLCNVIDWTTGEVASATVLVEISVRRHRMSNYVRK